MTPHEWILSDDTGISSCTIWGVMMMAPNDWTSPPWDPADFGRCFRLLEHFPEWRSRLPEVARVYPMWTGLVREWAELERLYREEEPTGTAPRLYARMQDLLDEGYVADGWVSTGRGGWTKEKNR